MKEKGSRYWTIVILLIIMIIVAVASSVISVLRQNKSFETVESVPKQTQGTDNKEGSTAINSSSGGIEVTATKALPESMDVYRYIKEAYELNELFAVEGFSSVKDISVSKLVQFSFCYLYVNEGGLVDVEVSSMNMRQANEEQIRTKIKELFGDCTADITKSDLYNSGSKLFEMWQPNYKRDVYAKAVVTESDGVYQFTVTYYKDPEKSQKAFSKVLKIMQSENNYYFAEMH